MSSSIEVGGLRGWYETRVSTSDLGRTIGLELQKAERASELKLAALNDLRLLGP